MARTGYYTVRPRPWPIILGFRVFGTAYRFVSVLWEKVGIFNLSLLVVSFACVVLTLLAWWSDIMIEGVMLGKETLLERRNYRCAFALFLFSEAIFFVGFLWAFVYSAVGYHSLLGVGRWPNWVIKPLKYWKLPAVGTVILIYSWPTSIWTWKMVKVHNKIHPEYRGGYLILKSLEDIENIGKKSSVKLINVDTLWMWLEETMSCKRIKVWLELGILPAITAILPPLPTKMSSRSTLSEANRGFIVTIALALMFTGIQVHEYKRTYFTIADGTFGSTFFVITGFHGLHVIVGTRFLITCLLRLNYFHFGFRHKLGAIRRCVLYWHFVDVVWIFVFLLVYIWGTRGRCW
jgi:heme/copper-type cytochrome/quinol oxidase subunit 3